MNIKELRQDRINRAEVEYAAALTQAQLAPSMYTNRMLKRADQKRKAARMFPVLQLVAAATIFAAALLFLIVVFSSLFNAGGTGEAEKRAQESCRVALMQQLDDAGIDRPLTEGELATCLDPEARAFMGL